MRNVFESLFRHWPSLPLVFFGLYYAWLDLMVFSPLVFSDTSEYVAAVRSEYLWWFFSAVFVLNVLCVLFARRLAPLLRGAGAPFAMALLLMACTVLCRLVVLEYLSSQWIVVASLLGAAGQTYLTLLMVMRFLSLSGYRVFVNLALMRIFAVMLYFMISGMPSVLGVTVLVLLLPVLAVTTHYSLSINPVSDVWNRALDTAWLAESEGRQTGAPSEPVPTGVDSPDDKRDLAGSQSQAIQSTGEEPAGFRGTLARVLVAGFALVFIMNSVGFGSAQWWPYVEWSCVLMAVLLVVILVYTGTKKRVILSYWYYVATISVILAFSIFAILPVSQPVGYVVCGSFRSVLDVFYLGFLIIGVSRSRISLIRLTGLFYSVYMGAVLMGLLMIVMVHPIVPAAFYSLGAVLIAIFTCVFLLFAFTPRDIQSLLGISFDKAPSRRQKSAEITMDKDVLSEVEKQFGLSNREREVFRLLMSGYTVRMMSDELFISPNTTKTHMHNIYMKVGVKSREELLRRVHGEASASLDSIDA